MKLFKKYWNSIYFTKKYIDANKMLNNEKRNSCLFSV